MSNKMLIDAAHPEETRVVVLRGNKVEEFDFEAADRQQLRGNIYLAKVTRVEPSLQAAFVDYGGNRHGFLAFSEIHPDYYQIPVADRQALMEEQAREDAEEAALEDAAHAAAGDARDGPDGNPVAGGSGESLAEGADADLIASDPDEQTESSGDGDGARSAAASEDDGDDQAPEAARQGDAPDPEEAGGPAATDSHGEDAPAGDDEVDHVGAEDVLEELPVRRKPRPRQYKIQEVIKRRQVMLVQVVKEERGNKGAALTTYLSLAGRYSVLMPNTARGGGISRKITNAADRKRLKAIAGDLDVAEGMGVILRTAGANRTKAEVRRDFEYLLRLWENVRELTLKSSAPKLVYEEGSLIKRSIRDLYSREIDEVLVAGDDGYREAKDFMRMLMPSHARNVQQYKDDVPVFVRHGVEQQLDAMFSPQVTLKSGGYVVINQTEALVAIDVNSGRSTREHSIEDTALQTNLQAAEEISRQLRLRDLAGLIVIDFIDMEEKRNNRAVEKKLKDCLKVDRARIQLGRISHFGLMEMSRQRLRTGVLESSTEACPTCRGSGQVRSVSSLTLQILRALDDHLLRDASRHLTVRTRPDAALYLLNHKRAHLAQLEARLGLTITVSAEPPDNGTAFLIEKGERVDQPVEPPTAVAMTHMEEPAEDEEDARGEAARDEGEEPRRKRRRRRRRRGEDADQPRADGQAATDGEDEAAAGEAAVPAQDAGEADDEDQPRKRRRRGRRGGRRRKRAEEGEAEHNGETREAAPADDQEAADDGEPADGPEPADAGGPADSGIPAETSPEPPERDPEPQAPAEASSERPAPATASGIDTPDDIRAGRSGADEDGAAARDSADDTAAGEAAGKPDREPEPVGPKRSGWWQRRSFL